MGRTGEARHLEGAADPGCPADRFVRPAGSRPAEDNRGSYRRTTGALGALAQGSTVRLPFLFTAAPTRSPRLLPLLPAGCPGPRFLPFTRPLACVRIRSLLSHHCTFTRSWTAFLQGSLIYQSHSLFLIVGFQIYFFKLFILYCGIADKLASLVAQIVKNPPAMQGDLGSDPWVRKIRWRRAWQPTPVFLPGESPWSLEDYSPWVQRLRQD